MYNEEDELLSLDEDYRLSQESAYVICKTEEALNYLNKKLEYNAVNEIYYEGNFPASFYYNFETDEWEEIKSRIEELQNEIDKLSKYIVKE